MTKYEQVKQTITRINEILESNTHQRVKQQLCSIVENLLMSTNTYKGFQYNYWTKHIDKWYDDGCPEKDKEKYIIGNNGVVNKDNPEFISDIEGEFSRTYFMKRN